jgi:CubicO group peptidase (beta-lactamase class C family)
VRASSNYASPHGATLSGDFESFPLENEEWITAIVPSGGAWSNVEDMGRYVITGIQKGVSPDGKRVVSKENLLATWEPQIPITATASYGLGWVIDQYKGAQMITHSGATTGFNSLVSFLPDHNLGVIVLTNVADAQSLNWAVTRQIYAALFKQPDDSAAILKGAFEAQQEIQQLKLADAIDAATVNPFLGRYTNPDLGDITLRLDNGKLRLDALGFSSELRGLPGPDGKIVAYLMNDVPLAGVPIILAEDKSGKPLVILQNPESAGSTFIFTPVM